MDMFFLLGYKNILEGPNGSEPLFKIQLDFI